MFLFLLQLFSINSNSQNSQISSKCFDEKSIQTEINSWTDKRAFLFGETHGFKVNRKIDATFIKLLNGRFKIKDIVIEMSPSVAYFFNNYVNTGDSIHLKGIIYSNYYLPILDSVKLYNRFKSNREKIKFWGFDFERVGPFTKLMKHVFDNSKTDVREMNTFMNLINKLNVRAEENRRNRQNATHFVKRFRKIYHRNYAMLCKMLTPNQVEMINGSIEVETSFKNRNKSNQEFFRLINKYFVNGSFITPFYCVMGSMHTDRSNVRSLSYLLENNPMSRFRGKVLNFHGHYKNAILENGDIINMGQLDWLLGKDKALLDKINMPQDSCKIYISKYKGRISNIADYIISIEGEKYTHFKVSK